MNEIIYTCAIKTPLGQMFAAASSNDEKKLKNANLCGLWFIDQKHFPKNINKWIENKNLHVFDKHKKWIECYFNREKNLPYIPIKITGSEFQQKVWKLLLEIPYGKTITYGELAEKITGKKAAFLARAVGGAVGRNPISLIIPCHRVIGAGGKITGYAGGLYRKEFLLKLET